MINVCLNVFITRHPLFRTVIYHRLFQKKVNLHVLNFGWPFKRGKDNKKTLIGMIKRWLPPLNRGRWLKGVLFTVFY